MNLFRDVQVEVETGEDGYLLRYVVTERARLADVRIEGLTLVQKPK